jgi:CRP/FNR family transcriptional regulator
MIFLRRVSLFGSMALEQLRVLSAHLTEHHYLPDEVIFSEGDFSQELYIVISGEIDIIKDHGSADARVLNTLSDGDFFGDMAIFERAARSATAVTRSESELLILQPEKFKQTIYQKPDMAFEIFREMCARIRRREEELSSDGS